MSRWNTIAYVPAPKLLKGFPGTFSTKRKTPLGGGLLRARWKDDDGVIYEWDYRHGLIEKFNRRGEHLGEFDGETGTQVSGPNSGKKVEP